MKRKYDPDRPSAGLPHECGVCGNQPAWPCQLQGKFANAGTPVLCAVHAHEFGGRPVDPDHFTDAPVSDLYERLDFLKR